MKIRGVRLSGKPRLHLLYNFPRYSNRHNEADQVQANQPSSLTHA